MAGVAQQRHATMGPGGQGCVKPEAPLAEFAGGDEGQQVLDEGAEIRIDVLHGLLVAARGVGFVRGGGEVRVGLCGRDVEDLLAGDWVRDDVPPGPDPADHVVAVEELE